MKKFLMKVLIFGVYAILIQVILPIWVDPFNVFHVEHIRANGVGPNRNYIKMKYILKNPNKFDSFLFGSSRVASIHTDKIRNEKCYNMTYVAGLPGWHLLNIETLFSSDVYPKKIYIGLDSISYTGDYESQIKNPMCCPYEYLKNDAMRFIKLYFDIASIAKSLDTIFRAWIGKIEVDDTEMFYKYGFYDRKSNFDWNNKRNLCPIYGSANKMDIASTLEVIRQIVSICRKNNTELIIFTNPMHYITYMGSVKDKNYFSFLEGLAEISDFWNFSSLNDITLNNDNYYETSHYKAKVGDFIIDIMCNGKSYPELQRQGFGVKVTRENAKEFISMLKQQAEEYEKLHH